MGYWTILISIFLFEAVKISEGCLEGNLDVHIAKPPSRKRMQYVDTGPEDQYVLVPDMFISCYGRITSWSGLALVQNTKEIQNHMHQIILIVWRPRSNNQYNMIGQNRLLFSPNEMKGNVFSIDGSNSTLAFFRFKYKVPSASISVQPGDVIGWKVEKYSKEKATVPLFLVSKKKTVLTGSQLEIIKITEDSSDAYCSNLFCDFNRRKFHVYPYISFHYELEEQRARFYMGSGLGKCPPLAKDCFTEENIILETDSQIEMEDSKSKHGRMSDGVLAAVIAACVAIAIILFIVLCALNYTFFYYYTKNNKIDVFPASSVCGNTDTGFKSRSSFPGNTNNHCGSSAGVSRSYPKGWSKSTVQDGNRIGVERDSVSRSYPKGWSKSTVQSSRVEFDSCDHLPPIAVHAASSPGSFRNDIIYRSIIKDSKSSMQPHRGSLDSSLDSKGLIKRHSSLPIVTPDDWDYAPERISKSSVAPPTDGISHAEGEFHIQTHPELTLSSTVISESLPEIIELSDDQNETTEFRTGLSGSLAETSIDISATSKETTGIAQEMILESFKAEDTLKESQNPVEIKQEKKVSAIFEVVRLPQEPSLNHVKPYYSSNTVPVSTMYVESDIDVRTADQVISRRSV